MQYGKSLRRYINNEKRNDYFPNFKISVDFLLDINFMNVIFKAQFSKVILIYYLREFEIPFSHNLGKMSVAI